MVAHGRLPSPAHDRAGAWADTAGTGPSQVRTPLTDSGAQLGGARPLA